MLFHKTQKHRFNFTFIFPFPYSTVTSTNQPNWSPITHSSSRNGDLRRHQHHTYRLRSWDSHRSKRRRVESLFCWFKLHCTMLPSLQRASQVFLQARFLSSTFGMLPFLRFRSITLRFLFVFSKNCFEFFYLLL